MQDIDIEKLLELRAFNETQEVYLIRAEGEFVGRIRNDSEGHNTKVFDEYHRLWGKVPREETTNILKEDRGIEIHLPFDVKKGEYIFIKVRNYFTTERDLSCVDWRFTGFKRLVKEYVRGIGWQAPPSPSASSSSWRSSPPQAPSCCCSWQVCRTSARKSERPLSWMGQPRGVLSGTSPCQCSAPLCSPC